MGIQKQMIEQLYSLAEKAQQPEQIKALQQQITRSIQDGAVPAYAAIPLVQDLTSRLQKAQTMQQTAGAQAQPQQPPIAEQVLTQAQGLDNMPSNLPTGEQAYAAGGIVAFAEGDLVDDDETETDDDRQESALMSLMSAARSKIQNLRAALPQSYEATLASQRTTTAPAGPEVPADIANAAKQHNLPPELLHRIAGSESGGRADAANPRSSAKGVFQFTDSTWKAMGGKPGEQFSREANVPLGAKYVRQNAEYLKGSLGRDPTYHEVYAAHMFGPGVSKMLNKANPKDPIESGLALFESPQMVKKIMRSNPNLRGKTVGEVLNSLETKTGQGIVALAQGGEIKHFDEGGGPTEEEIQEAKKPYIGYKTGKRPAELPTSGKSFLDWLLPQDYPVEAAPAATKEDRKRQAQMEYQDLIEGSAGRDLIRPQAAPTPPIVTAPSMAPTVPGVPSALSGIPAAPQAPITEAIDPYLEKYMGMLQKRETESEKQKQSDAYLALMQAGLGMMGGSSPYAFQNIGQGGTQGLASYAAAQKQRAAEDAATLSGYGKLYTAKQAADLRRDLAAESKDVKLTQLEQNKIIAANRLAQEKEVKLNNLVAGREKQLETVAYNNVIRATGNTFTDMTPEQKTMAVNAEIQRLKAGDTLLKKYYNELGLPPVETVGVADPLPDYNKLYGLTPKK